MAHHGHPQVLSDLLGVEGFPGFLGTVTLAQAVPHIHLGERGIQFDGQTFSVALIVGHPPSGFGGGVRPMPAVSGWDSEGGSPEGQDRHPEDPRDSAQRTTPVHGPSRQVHSDDISVADAA